MSSLSTRSERLSGVSVKGNGNVLVCQTDEDPSVIVLSVDTLAQKVNIQGELSATTLHGKSIRSSEIVSATGAASLDTDVTEFTNSNYNATLAAGTDGQVKYLLRTSAAGGGDIDTVLALPGTNTRIELKAIGDGATIIYNASTAVWVPIGLSGAAALS